MRQELLLMPRSLIDKKSERRYDDCLKYTTVGSKKALKAAGLDPQVCSGQASCPATRHRLTPRKTSRGESSWPIFLPHCGVTGEWSRQPCKCSVQDNADEFEKLDLQRVGVLVGTGMGGLQVFQDGVQNLVERGYKKISPFFIPYAITNMCAEPA